MPIKVGPIQVEPLGGTHIPSDGSHIADGCPDPSLFLARQGSPSEPSEFVIYVEGKAFATAEVFFNIPICQNTGHLTLEFQVKVDGGIVSLNVFEHDLKVSLGGKTWNASMQTNITRGGLIQTSDPTQGWNDTAIVIGPLSPYLVHSYIIDIQINWAAGTFVYDQIDVDGVISHFDGKLIPASQTGWADGVLFQVQLGLGAQGGVIGITLDEVYATWS